MSALRLGPESVAPDQVGFTNGYFRTCAETLSARSQEVQVLTGTGGAALAAGVVVLGGLPRRRTAA